MTELLPIDTRAHRARLTADDFELLDRSGAFAAYRKTELVDGEVWFVNAQHRPHGMVKMRLYDALSSILKQLGSEYRAVCEFTLALSATDRPEPDVMLTNEPEGEGPVPLVSVPLVIEVSDTTLDDDLGVKLRRYAEAGVREYWVADVNGRVIHQMWSPVGSRYVEHQSEEFGVILESKSVPNLIVSTGTL